MFFSYITTHNTHWQGGRKTHICEGKTGASLCGYSNLHDAYPVDVNWINQPDSDNELCKKCKKIALTKIKKEL